jgi:hypothetical protein
MLDTAFSAATQPLLEQRYGASPYLAVVRGEQMPAYQALEDSLRAYAAAHPVDVVRERETRRTTVRDRPGRAAAADSATGDRPRRGGRPVRKGVE